MNKGFSKLMTDENGGVYMRLKRVVAVILMLCFVMNVAVAEEQNKNVLQSVGDWFGQAWEDSSKWVTQAWDDSSKWVGQAWEDSTKWVGQAWEDSSKWVGQAWNDSSAWVAGNWSEFVIWLKTVTYDNPYSWIRDMVLEEGILAYDEFVSIREFVSTNPDSAAIKAKCYDLLSELSLLNEEKEVLWDLFSKWAEEHKVTTEQVALLSIPFIERLNIKGEEAFGKDIDITGIAIAQYLITILETMKINSHEDAESRQEKGTSRWNSTQSQA